MLNVKVTAAVVALAGVLVWQLGVFDRPKFELQEALLKKNDSGVSDLYAIVAITKGSVSPQVEKLATGTLKGIESLADSKELLESAAKLYPETPEGAERLALSIYFDDPKDVKEEDQRWALGWAVHSPHGGFGEIQSLVDKVQEASGIIETFRALRISNKGNVLKASIPWRNYFTPMIQPRIQWNRGYKVYEERGYDSKVYKGPISLEVYVTGANDSFEHIDYVILFGDTKHTWDDAFSADHHVVDSIVTDE